MTEHAHPPTKVLVVIGIIVMFWLLVSICILGAFGITESWPAFLTLPLFFLTGGNDKKQLINVFGGAAVGLLLVAASVQAVGFLASTGLGLQPAVLLMVGLVVFLIIALGGVIPTLFNNHTFVYFTVAVIFTKQATLPWLGTLIIGGAFFVGTCLLTMNFILPRLMKGQPAGADN